MSKILRAYAKVILFESKTLADGSHPIMLKVTFKGQRKYYRTGFSMGEKSFNHLTQATRLSREQTKIQIQLSGIEVKAKSLIDRLIEDKKSFSFSMFEKAFFVITANTDVFHLYEERIAYHHNRGGYSTRDTYKNAMSHLRKYVGSKKRLLLEDITPEFLINYEKAHHNLSPNTIGMYERTLKTIFNLATQDGIISHEINPFTKHKIPFRPGKKQALIKEDMLKVLNFETKRYSTEWLAQQVYIFSYLCNGMNLKDMVNLRWSDISDGRIFFIRSKTIGSVATPKIQSIKITLELESILGAMKKYKASESDFIFPVLRRGATDEEHYRRKNDFVGVVNDNIRKIAKQVGINRDFTFYSARHSWATILKRAGVSIELISEGMSHSNLKVTERYLDSFGDEALDQANELLL